jgi:DnaK suppressor protein
MTSREQEKHQQRLLAMATRLKDDDEGVASDALRQASGDVSGNLSNVPMHLADLGTDAFEQEMSASLLTNARQLQAEVAAALDRIENGTFGKCQQCGGEISGARLEALPYTRYCVDCAQSAENEGEAGSQPTLL